MKSATRAPSTASLSRVTMERQTSSAKEYENEYEPMSHKEFKFFL
jgi:hypothetical protein